MTPKEINEYILSLAQFELDQCQIEAKWARHYARKGDQETAAKLRRRADIHHAKYTAYHGCWVLTLCDDPPETG